MGSITVVTVNISVRITIYGNINIVLLISSPNHSKYHLDFFLQNPIYVN